MLTPRGWWFLVCVLLLLAFARLGVTIHSLGPPRLAPRANDTLGVLLKYQDDIAKIRGTEAARILDEIKLEISAARVQSVRRA